MMRSRSHSIAICAWLLSFAAVAGSDAPSQVRERLAELKGGDGPVFGLAWSPDDTALAAAGYRQVNVWRVGATSPVHTFRGHPDLVRDVAWSPDGRWIASAGQEGTVQIWNAESLSVRVTLKTGPARAVDWSPDGSRVVTGSEIGDLQVWRAGDGERVHAASVQTTISSVSWSPDGASVAVGGINGMWTRWSVNDGRLLMKRQLGGPQRQDVNGVAWSPHARVLATAHGARGVGAVRLWNPLDGAALQLLESGTGWVRAMSWSPDATCLAVGGEDGRVRIWNVERAVVVADLPTDSRPVWSIAWSHDGRRLAAGNAGTQAPGGGGTVTIWESPVSMAASRDASTRAREVESALLTRRSPDAAAVASEPARPPTLIKEGEAHGTIVRLESPFGNLETSLSEDDLRTLGIADGRRLNIRCRERQFSLILGKNWTDVPRGEWVGYVSLQGYLLLARNGASAAEASGCQAGDVISVSAQVKQDE